MSRWHVWTDGSAITDPAVGPRRRLRDFPGGWAAVLEHGSDGFVLRGRAEHTTNVRMELAAATEGLRAVPTGDHVTLHVDCTVVLAVLDRWEGRYPWEPVSRKRDAAWWEALAAQFGRLADTGFEVDLLDRAHPVHSRAHSIARVEAKSARAGLPADLTILSPFERKKLRAAAVHQRGCAPFRCVTDCPVYRQR